MAALRAVCDGPAGVGAGEPRAPCAAADNARLASDERLTTVRESIFLERAVRLSALVSSS